MIAVSDLDDRIAKCERILDTNPNSQIFAALAEAYRKKGELERAFRTCQNGLRVHPSYGSAHVVMAKINLDRGLYDWAEIEANKAIELLGRCRPIDLLLAEIYIYRGDVNAALKLLRKLQEENPDHPQIKKLLAIARKLPEQAAGLIGESATGHADGAAGPEKPLSAGSAVSTAKDLVHRSMAIPGVFGALLLNLEGLVIESEWAATTDPLACGASIGGVFGSFSQLVSKTSFGEVATILIETEDPTFYLVKVVDGVLLLAAGPSANLGTLRARVQHLLDSYQ
ncbi:MAG TPA: tetratricopeptide repeat protein [Candidatus Deferrimicrobium sp.]|nr:tetratricopeptide repeat protein [Candidatus Deferrimicrobium sp.]